MADHSDLVPEKNGKEATGSTSLEQFCSSTSQLIADGVHHALENGVTFLRDSIPETIAEVEFVVPSIFQCLPEHHVGTNHLLLDLFHQRMSLNEGLVNKLISDIMTAISHSHTDAVIWRISFGRRGPVLVQLSVVFASDTHSVSAVRQHLSRVNYKVLYGEQVDTTPNQHVTLAVYDTTKEPLSDEKLTDTLSSILLLPPSDLRVLPSGEKGIRIVPVRPAAATAALLCSNFSSWLQQQTHHHGGFVVCTAFCLTDADYRTTPIRQNLTQLMPQHRPTAEADVFPTLPDKLPEETLNKLATLSTDASSLTEGRSDSLVKLLVTLGVPTEICRSYPSCIHHLTTAMATPVVFSAVCRELPWILLLPTFPDLIEQLHRAEVEGGEAQKAMLNAFHGWIASAIPQISDYDAGAKNLAIMFTQIFRDSPLSSFWNNSLVEHLMTLRKWSPAALQLLFDSAVRTLGREALVRWSVQRWWSAVRPALQVVRESEGDGMVGRHDMMPNLLILPEHFLDIIPYMMGQEPAQQAEWVRGVAGLRASLVSVMLLRGYARFVHPLAAGEIVSFLRGIGYPMPACLPFLQLRTLSRAHVSHNPAESIWWQSRFSMYPKGRATVPVVTSSELSPRVCLASGYYVWPLLETSESVGEPPNDDSSAKVNGQAEPTESYYHPGTGCAYLATPQALWTELMGEETTVESVAQHAGVRVNSSVVVWLEDQRERECELDSFVLSETCGRYLPYPPHGNPLSRSAALNRSSDFARSNRSSSFQRESFDGKRQRSQDAEPENVDTPNDNSSATPDFKALGYPARGFPFPRVPRELDILISRSTGHYYFARGGGGEPFFAHPIDNNRYAVTPQAAAFKFKLSPRDIAIKAGVEDYQRTQNWVRDQTIRDKELDETAKTMMDLTYRMD